MRLSKKEREGLKEKYGGRCAYCGCVLEEKWHADHMEPVYRVMEHSRCQNSGRAVFKQTGSVTHKDRDVLENLAPSCVSCNLYKSVYGVEEFRSQIANTINVLENITAFKFARKFGLVTKTDATPVFYFEELP